MDTQRGIAGAKGIPWHLPGDVGYFRQQTTEGIILMGRSTYAEFDAPLHGRTNLVLMSNPGELRSSFQPVASLAEAVGTHPGEDIWVIGGAAVYTSTLAEADELVITQIFADFECTKFFPDYHEEFSLVEHGDEQHEGDITYRFERWRRG
jgi:dihydrofolate reductase